MTRATSVQCICTPIGTLCAARRLPKVLCRMATNLVGVFSEKSPLAAVAAVAAAKLICVVDANS